MCAAARLQLQSEASFLLETTKQANSNHNLRHIERALREGGSGSPVP